MKRPRNGECPQQNFDFTPLRFNRHLTVENLESGDIIHDVADVVISARGSLNEMSWPDIPGLKEMAIPVMHPAAWDDR